MLQGFVDKLIALWTLPPDLDGPHEAEPAVARDDQHRRELRRAVSDLAADGDHGGKVLAGTLTVVGLEPVRALLGEDWDAMAAQVDRITASVLARMVRPPDFATRHDADTVLVLFATPNRLVAEQRASDVARAIEQALNLSLGPLAQRFHVDHFVAEVRLSDAVEIDRSDVTSGLVVVLQRIREEARLSDKPAANGWMRSARLVFQPLWDVRHAQTGANRCILEVPGADATLGRLETLDGSRSVTEAMARIDFVTLTRAAETLQIGAREHRQATLLVPVHYQTLEQRSWRNDYLRLAAMLPSDYRRYLQIEILGLPADATSTALASHVALLDVASPWIVLQLSLHTPQPAGLARSGLAGLSCNFAEFSSLKGLTRPLAALVHSAEAEGLATYAVGVNTIGHAEAARDAGFAYIGGSAIHMTATEPRLPGRLAPLPYRPAQRRLGQLPTV
jgi:EAL domain-containing protein (putative c-di-GMP-specific phosphodiesterase class I)